MFIKVGDFWNLLSMSTIDTLMVHVQSNFEFFSFSLPKMKQRTIDSRFEIDSKRKMTMQR